MHAETSIIYPGQISGRPVLSTPVGDDLLVTVDDSTGQLCRVTLAGIADVIVSASNALVADGSDVSGYEGLILVGSGATSELKYNLAATTNPTAGDDSGDGYSIGSRWINVSSDKEFVCLDASSGAAVWTETTQAGGSGSGSGSGGSGISSLNGLTDSTQTLARVNDANVTLAISSASGTHTITAGWSGTLSHARGGLEADVSSFGGVPLITGGTTSELKYNLAATTDPTAGDDSGDGYSIGSRWINVSTDKEFVCLDASSGAAVWTETTQASGSGSGSSSDQSLPSTIGDTNDRLEVRAGQTSWQPRTDACLARVAATANVDLSGPWHLSAASYASKTAGVETEAPEVKCVRLSPDGTKLFVLGSSNNTLHRYTLSTPGDLSTKGLSTASLDLSGVDTDCSSFCFNAAGTRLYVIGEQNDRLTEFSLSAWAISGATATGYTLDLGVYVSQARGLNLSASETRLFVTNRGGTGSVYTIDMATANDLSTGTLNLSETFALGTNEVEDLAFRDDGRRMFALIGATTGELWQVRLATPWTVSTAVITSVVLDVAPQTTIPYGLAFLADGTSCYVGSQFGVATIYQYDFAAGSDPSPIDGVTLTDGDRVLLQNQTSTSENGVYDAATAADPSTWTRVAEMDAGGSASGRLVAVTAGTTYGTTVWICTTAAGSDVVDTNNLTFTRFV